MRLLLTFLLVLIPSFVLHAIPVDLHFTPQPAHRIQIPKIVAGADAVTLKTYEIEIAHRIEESGDNPFLSHKLGSVLYHQGRTDEAQRVWRRTAAEEKNLPSADFMAELEELYALIASQNQAEAQKKLEAIEKQYSDNSHFLLIQAEKAMQSGNLEAAGKAYQKAVTLAPDLFVTHLNHARYLDFRQDFPAAERAFKKALELAPEHKDCLNAYAVFLFKLDRLKESLQYFRKLHRLDDAEPIAEVQLAKLSTKLNDNIGARYWYKNALESESERADAIRIALSDIQLRLNLYDEAAENIQSVLTREKIPPLFIALGTIYEAKLDYARAEQSYRQALDLQPENVIANNNLAMLLVRMQKSAEEALFFAEKAYVKKSDNPMILGTYGCSLYVAGQNRKAKEILAKVIKVSPGDAWSRYFYGSLLYREKDFQMAKMHLEGVLIINPEFIHAADIRKKLTAMTQ